VRSYPILAASGRLGPKLRQGDKQVPEGLYRIESLNPNSRFHLALRVDYPNAFDQRQAARDRRSDLGGDIMIHGGAASIGCLAMGDEAAEDLFVLVAEVGKENVEVLLSPVDFREQPLPAVAGDLQDWTPELHSRIRARLEELPPARG
jgi:murein L,D-transpeptidase YafK